MISCFEVNMVEANHYFPSEITNEMEKLLRKHKLSDSVVKFWYLHEKNVCFLTV